MKKAEAKHKPKKLGNQVPWKPTANRILIRSTYVLPKTAAITIEAGKEYATRNKNLEMETVVVAVGPEVKWVEPGDVITSNPMVIANIPIFKTYKDELDHETQLDFLNELKTADRDAYWKTKDNKMVISEYFMGDEYSLVDAILYETTA